MNLITRSVPRALILAALTATALYAATATAWAHVEVEANNAVRGGEAILTFEVPNESDKGALTTQFSVALPNVTSASTESMPGWTVRWKSSRDDIQIETTTFCVASQTPLSYLVALTCRNVDCLT